MKTESALPWLNNPTWKMFECEKGNRYCGIIGSPFDETKNGQSCIFSGCEEDDHKIYLTGETKDSEEAAKWYLNKNHSREWLATIKNDL